MKKINEAMFSYLTDDNNFEVALELESLLTAAKLKIKEDFVVGVVSRLKELLTKSASDQTWVVETPYSSGEVWNISIRRSQALEPRSYECFLEGLFAEGKGTWFGWIRGRSLPANTATLSLRMKQEDFKCDNWWIGWKNLDKRYVLEQDNGIRQFFNDNLSSDHPLRKGIVDTMWNEFTKYRTEIESLPDFCRPV